MIVSGNKLKKLNSKLLKNNIKLLRIHLEWNPWDCSNCEDIKEIYLHLKKINGTISDLICETPTIFINKTWESTCFKSTIKRDSDATRFYDEWQKIREEEERQKQLERVQKDEAELQAKEQRFVVFVVAVFSIIITFFCVLAYLFRLTKHPISSEFHRSEESERLNVPER